MKIQSKSIPLLPIVRCRSERKLRAAFGTCVQCISITSAVNGKRFRRKGSSSRIRKQKRFPRRAGIGIVRIYFKLSPGAGLKRAYLVAFNEPVNQQSGCETRRAAQTVSLNGGNRWDRDLRSIPREERIHYPRPVPTRQAKVMIRHNGTAARS